MFVAGSYYKKKSQKYLGTHRTNQIVLAITVGIACLGETSIHWRKTNQSALTGA
jgi:hypothetical protein